VVLWAVARIRKHSAEAGIGKSTLMQALHTHVGREEATWITCRCSPYRTKSALYPITEYLSRALRWQPDESATMKLDKLAQVLRPSPLSMQETLLLLAALLSIQAAHERNETLLTYAQEQGFPIWMV
jgi:predicted ATPase